VSGGDAGDEPELDGDKIAALACITRAGGDGLTGRRAEIGLQGQPGRPRTSFLRATGPFTQIYSFRRAYSALQGEIKRAASSFS
jgi:hypothetical protein